jgi:hypothetical protein
MFAHAHKAHLDRKELGQASPTSTGRSGIQMRLKFGVLGSGGYLEEKSAAKSLHHSRQPPYCSVTHSRIFLFHEFRETASLPAFVIEV